MRPLPVLILVLLAILATVAAIFLSRGGDEGGEAVAPGPVQPAVVAPAEADRQPTAPADTRAVTPVPIAATTTDPDDDNTPVNNRVEGLVLNDKSEPLPGATVKMSTDAMMGESLANDFFVNREPSEKPPLSTTTDAKGQYVFRAVDPARNYYVMAHHPEYSAAQEDEIRVTKQGTIRVETILLRPGSVMSGFVQEVDGNAIPDAEVHLDSAYMMGIDMASPDRLTARTDGQGFYEFKNVAAGARIVSATAPGHETQIHSDLNFSGAAGERVERNFKLELGHPIGGRVYGPDNESVVGARVLAINYASNVSSRGEAITDENGNFLIENLSRGAYILMLRADGYRQARQNRVQVGELNLEIEMLRQNTLSGYVLDSGTGKPVENFKVQLLHVNNAVPTQGSALFNYEPTTIKTESSGAADGAFQLTSVDPGLFALRVNAPGYASKVSDNFQVVDNVITPPIRIGLSKGGSIKGRVVDGTSGNPVSGVQVSSHDGDLPDSMNDPFLENMVATRTTERKTRTNDDGFFELKLLNVGRYRVQLEHPNYTVEWVANLVVGEGQVTDAGSVSMRSGGTINGKVVDGSGKPCARAVIRLYGVTGEVLSTRADTEGRYSIAHIKPGDYKLSASRPATGTDTAFDNLIEQTNSEQQVQIFEGQQTNRELKIGN